MENVSNIVMSLAVLAISVVIVAISLYLLCRYKSLKVYISDRGMFVDRNQFNGGPNPCGPDVGPIEMMPLSCIGENLFLEK